VRDKKLSDWVSATLPRSNHHKANLFCFPYAGGGVVAYHAWKNLLHPDIALLRMQLPGRETRLREKPFTAFFPLIKALISAIAPWLDSPFVFYGHSLGALIAFEVARMLRDLGKPLPFHLFISSFRAPHLPDPDQMISKLPENQFIECLKQYDGIAPAIVTNSELMEIYLPILKADFSILSSYHYTQKAPLPCPITAFAGLSDPKISAEEIAEWQDHTTGRYNSHFFPGGHFFINESQSEMLAHMNRYLEQRFNP
jgi:medium-chain acyl-[acyl-carrier-protein] hydrolase